MLELFTEGCCGRSREFGCSRVAIDPLVPYSDLCTRAKKIFTEEHTLYTPDQLAIHLPSLRRYESTSGNKARGEMTEGDIHPICDFCREALYGEDEHFAHMRERHEECFICKREGVLHQ